MGSILHHITPLVINSLRGGHTDTRCGQNQCPETRRAPACGWRAWFKKLEMNTVQVSVYVIEVH